MNSYAKLGSMRSWPVATDASLRIIGLMSGTSLDGIDAALCEIRGSGANLQAQLLAFECLPYSPTLRERLARACANLSDVREVTLLNIEVARAFADAANFLQKIHSPADAIASHGQTICHLPGESATLQIGDGSTIAARTNCPTVFNFRTADMALGGQGAPLVPYADWVLLRDNQRHRVIQNIGGIANCTLLPANTSLDAVRAWDTGPGNLLLDAATQRFFDQPCDFNGELAGQGKVNENALNRALNHPYFSRVPPKTTGREEFGPQFLEEWLQQNTELRPPDVLATLTCLTARTIADSLRQHSGLPADFDLIVGGGGAFNPTLMDFLRDELPQAQIFTHEDFGIPSAAKEALAFAILGSETLRGVATNVPTVTGASRSTILGQIAY